MDAAMLIVSALGLIAAALAAWFAFPAWKASRAKPDLRVELLKGPATSAQFYIRLVNVGTGPAVDWMATFATKPGTRLMLRDRHLKGWVDRDTGAGWIATWLSDGPYDSIGPGMYRDVTIDAGSPTVTEARYTITIGGKDHRSGNFRADIDEDREQLVAAT